METVDMENLEAKMPDKFDKDFLMERVPAVLKNEPKIWEKIRCEYADIRSLYLGYFIYIALVPTLALFLMVLVSSTTIVQVVLNYILTLLAPIVFALVMEQVALRFESQVDRVNALKLVMYTSTPMVLAGIFVLIPLLAPLASLLAFIYSIYLMIKAAPLFVTIKEGKEVLFWAFSIGLAVVIMMVIVTILVFL